MEQKKRGRPKLHAEITEAYAPSRRQAINAMYMYEAVCELSVAATEIPNHEILWYSDSKTKTAGGKHGIMEQLGRMLVQDQYAQKGFHYGCKHGDSFLPALGHVHADDDSGVVTAPTCAEQGYTTYICKRCGESYQGDFVDTVPHDYEAVVSAPTCTEQGYTTYTCSHCGEWYTDNYTDAAGHHIVVDEAVEATCGEDGHTIGSHCDRCGQVFITPTVLPATGKHVSSDENRATATHRAICDLCGQEYGEPLPITCDLNGDDKTDADDLAILLRHVAKIEVITDEDLLPRLDLDGSGAVNAADVTALAKLLSK